MEKKDMLEDFCYAHFDVLGRGLLKVFKGVEDNMEAANMRLHPEVYLSIVGFVACVLSAIPVLFLPLLFVEIVPPVLPIPFLILIFLSPPLVTLLIGAFIPKTIASNRISGLRNEIPYASMYLSVMASGGLSPYASLLRLRKTELLPKLRTEIERIERIILSSGMDPVSAMAKAAKTVGLKEYKELLLGYASTMKTGGDILHYLYSQTESMFRKMALRIKSMGDHMALLMEGYTTIAILGTLGIYMIFIVSMSFPKFQALPPEMFILFSFAVLPGISLAFLYFADTLQINYPISQWKTYLVLLVSAPICFLTLSQTVLPYFGFRLLPATFISDIPLHLRDMLSLNDGCEPALGLAVSLIILSLPVYFSDRHFSETEKGVLDGVTSFLRDLVENRKTGLSPEKSIQSLADRGYGKFSKYLKLMSAEIGWGISLRRIFEDFKNKVRNWLCLVNLYLLIDTIEVGGGTEESLETLAEFAESTRELESERKSHLAPLFIVPYMGAAILTVTTIMLLQLFTNMSIIGGVPIPIKELIKMLITPLVLHSFTLGIVTGKIVSGRVSAGFKHAIILIIISVAGIWTATHILT
ncbi:MAG: type II secretion system F family protein [Candidatus Bathyarchaeota archaeon]|nr:type II secretion system F family protein [Candidatus Bathyarchaeota archaeon]